MSTTTKAAPGPLAFRLATLDDADHLASLISTAFRSEKTGDTWLYDSQDKRTDIASPELMKHFIDSNSSIMLVGHLPNDPEKKALATCFLLRPLWIPDEVSEHRSSGAAWLGFLATDPECHRSGYELAILQYAEAFVQRERGCQRLELDHVNTRTVLGAWYERCGYVDTGRRRPFPYGGNGREILREGLEQIVRGKDLVIEQQQS